MQKCQVLPPRTIKPNLLFKTLNKSHINKDNQISILKTISLSNRVPKTPHTSIRYHSTNDLLLKIQSIILKRLFLIYNYQIIRMPFICKAFNRFPRQSPSLQRVKQEEPPSIEQESSILSLNGNNQEENRQTSEGRWNQDENFRFVIFVHHYQDIFVSRHRRKVCKIFRVFSQYLQGRSAAQCRSHYQKMMIRHKSIAKLKKYYKKMQGEKEYNQQLERFRLAWGEARPINHSILTEIKQFKEIGVQTDQQQNQISCERCLGLRSERDVTSSSMPVLNHFPIWGDANQPQSNPYMTLMYWIPQINDPHLSA